MDVLVAEKSSNLQGKIKLKGAKNSILPIIAACLLTSDDVLICNCPDLSDIRDMLQIVESIGGKVSFDSGNICVCCKQIDPCGIDKNLMSKIRSSIFILGPLLARCGEAQIAMPGGCEIGSRPIDLHLDGLKKLGVSVQENCVDSDNIIKCKGKPVGGIVRLRYPSVGATENLMMASVLSGSRTAIYGCAKEPEIVDLAMFLNTLGARVYGAGTNLIVIEGKNCLHGARYKPIPDRIAAGTFISAVAACQGDIYLDGAIGDHLDTVLHKFRMAGVNIVEEQKGIRAYCDRRLSAIKQTVTLPYPGFPTDMQPLLVAVLCTASGQSVITETLFENRFRYAYQLGRMGADIILDGSNTAIINGKNLYGANVYAQDLRGGAALTVAAICAQGQSVIFGVEHIDRGYEFLETELSGVGASVVRKQV